MFNARRKIAKSHIPRKISSPRHKTNNIATFSAECSHPKSSRCYSESSDYRSDIAFPLKTPQTLRAAMCDERKKKKKRFVLPAELSPFNMYNRIKYFYSHTHIDI